MKRMMSLLVVLLVSVMFGGCAMKTGTMTVNADGTVTGSTRSIQKIEAASRANTRAGFIQAGQFDKVPFDGTDKRTTRNTSSSYTRQVRTEKVSSSKEETTSSQKSENTILSNFRSAYDDY